MEFLLSCLSPWVWMWMWVIWGASWNWSGCELSEFEGWKAVAPSSAVVRKWPFRKVRRWKKRSGEDRKREAEGVASVSFLLPPIQHVMLIQGSLMKLSIEVSGAWKDKGEPDLICPAYCCARRWQAGEDSEIRSALKYADHCLCNTQKC